MDPIACIIASLVGELPRREALDALRGWYGRAGFRPSVGDVRAEADRRDITLPPRWRSSARALGATDEAHPR